MASSSVGAGCLLRDESSLVRSSHALNPGAYLVRVVARVVQKAHTAMFNSIMKSGSRTPTSGIWSLVDQYGRLAGQEYTMKRGQTFPPTPYAGMGYVLVRPAYHRSGV
jgi:hypothetical protein